MPHLGRAELHARDRSTAFRPRPGPPLSLLTCDRGCRHSTRPSSLEDTSGGDREAVAAHLDAAPCAPQASCKSPLARESLALLGVSADALVCRRDKVSYATRTTLLWPAPSPTSFRASFRAGGGCLASDGRFLRMMRTPGGSRCSAAGPRPSSSELWSTPSRPSLSAPHMDTLKLWL